ncbi:hypothetical protein [Vibrio ostreicida]|uniref:hypothetical protein n=1 Tax=Vibrio ostreicida TaxID=526588 RepID=UPI001FE88393|nr:hypothetical protein [Vibrio ostreicida]
MKIVFRVDASRTIGSGHMMRCLVLGEALKDRGAIVEFACLEQQGDMIAYVEERGFCVLRLTVPTDVLTPKYENDYAAWLLRPASEDAWDFVNVVVSADIVITDHYGIDAEWQRYVAQKLNCFMVAIDDLVRYHFADMVIDQTLGRKVSEYARGLLVLTGSDYAILGRQFLKHRPLARGRVFPTDSPSILVSMGGLITPMLH